MNNTTALYIVAAILWSRGSTSMEDAIMRACELQDKIEELNVSGERVVRKEMRESKRS